MTTNKKVILIYPEGRKIGNYPIQKGHDYTLQLPISLLPIACFLRNGGYDPIIFDARVEDYRNLSLEGAICVGISTMTGIQIANALDIAGHIRSVNPKMPIVWGGIHPSLLPEETVSHDLVDIVVRGEGEATMLELVQCLEDERPLVNVAGITYKDNNHIVTNPDRDFIDLNQLHQLPYDLFRVEKYKHFMLSDEFFLNTSRGCPHGCTFCYNLAFNKRKWRYQSSSVVIDQVARIVKEYSVKRFFFGTEDNFFVSKERVEEICRGLIEREIKIKWLSFCRADYFARYSDDFLNIIREGGCKTLLFGGESGSPYILNKINKNILPEHLIMAAKKCGYFDIKPVFSFISGFPFEGNNDMMNTFKVIDQIVAANDKAEINGIFVLIPYPGTPIFEVAKQAGFKVPKTLEDWVQFQFSNVDNLPWLDRKKRIFLNTLYRISTFPFVSKSPNFPPALRSAEAHSSNSFLRFLVFQLKRCVWLFYWVSARIRWKHKLFGWSLEWKLWEWYARRDRVW